jgi:hypothetical protein
MIPSIGKHGKEMEGDKKCSTSPAVENFQLLFDFRLIAPKNSELNFSVAKIFASGCEMCEWKIGLLTTTLLICTMRIRQAESMVCGHW